MKIIDLFCGAGGLSVGFEMAGFTPILAIDKWGDAISTYNNNHKGNVGTTVDIHQFSNEQLRDIANEYDVMGIIGGPPCQGFSLVGTRDSQDLRNSLYLEYVRYVSVIKPDFFVLENVKGLLSLDNGKYKQDIIERFTELGYNVVYDTLRASDYGVPQARERVFFIGLKKQKFKDLSFEFSKLSRKAVVTTEDAISDLPTLEKEEESYRYVLEPQNDFQHRMRYKSAGVFNHVRTNHTQKTIDIIAMVPDGGNIHDLPKEYYQVRNYNNAFRRMNSKLPSNTIDCGHRNYFHYAYNRIPTVRESARIQSFPDTYIFTGSKTSQYTQVGNAVPPLLSNAIAEILVDYLKVLD